MILWRASVRHLFAHPWQLGLSVLGIALGVAVVVAIDLANESARRAFSGFAETVTGRATHRIVGGPSGLPEALYARLRLAGLRELAPVVERQIAVLDPPGGVLHLLGVDPFAESPFRNLLTSDTTDTAESLTVLLTRPSTAVLAQATATRLGLRPGDTFVVRVGAERHRLHLVGILIPSDPLRARSLEELLVTDVATAQELTGTVGRLSAIDVLAPPGPGGAAVLARLRAELPASADIVEASDRARTLADLSRGFSVNLTALSLLALFVGLFLVYNAMSFSVVQRRPLIATLRALGVTRREIWALIMTEALVLGAIATAIGLPAGVALGHGLLGLVTRTINDLYVAVTVDDLLVAPLALVTGAALGIAGPLLAALTPAFEATRSTPRAALGRSVLESRARALAPRLALAGSVLVAAGAATLAVERSSLALGYVGLFTILLGAALLTPAATVGIARLCQPLAGRWFGLLGRMATGGVAAALSRTGVAVAALMVAVAASVSVGIMIASFRASVVHWLDTALQADVYVSAPGVAGRRPDGTLSDDVIARLRAVPGVAAVSTQRTLRVEAPGRSVNVIVLELPPQGYRALALKAGDPATVGRRLQAGEVVLVSEPFAYHRRLGVGDTVRLRTDAGERDFPIGGVVFDYGSSEGMVMIGRRAWERFWNDRAVSGLGIYADSPDAVPSIVESLRRAAGEQDLLIRSNRALREASLKVFERTFAVTRVLRWLAIVVAFVGVLSALMAQALERAHEIGLLRAQGLSPAGVWGLTVAQTGFLGSVAGLLALPVGIALAVVLIFVINRRSFGWTLSLEMDPVALAQALVLAVGGALLAAIYPAWRMSTMAVSSAVREE